MQTVMELTRISYVPDYCTPYVQRYERRNGRDAKLSKLLKINSTRKTWSLGMCKEMGRLLQGFKGLVEGTNTAFFMDRQQIREIPKDKTVMYACIVVIYCPQKADPHRVRVTVGGNLLNVPEDLSTRTAELTTSKILWNSVLSTKDARHACIDIENMYLQTLLKV